MSSDPLSSLNQVLTEPTVASALAARAVLAETATERGLLTSKVLVREVQLPGDTAIVRDVLQNQAKMLGDTKDFFQGISAGIGEVIGGLFGGIAKGAIDAVAESVKGLVSSLLAEVEHFLATATERLRNVALQVIKSLEDAARRVVYAVVSAVRLAAALVQNLLRLIETALLNIIYEAAIQVYDVVSSVPFASKAPRIVYASPILFRPNVFPPEVTLHGNFLTKLGSWRIGDEQVKPLASAPNKVTLPIPPKYLAGNADVFVTVEGTWPFVFPTHMKTEKQSLRFFIGEKIEFGANVRVQPEISVRQPGSSVHHVDFGIPGGINFPFGDGQRTRRFVLQPANPKAKIKSVRWVNLSVVSASQNAFLDTGANVAIVDVVLDSVGAFPGGRWVTGDLEVLEEQEVTETGEPAESAIEFDEKKTVLEASTGPYARLAEFKARAMDGVRWKAHVEVTRTPAGDEPVKQVFDVATEPGAPIIGGDAGTEIQVADDGSVYLKLLH